eukprot:834171-Pelagomonas_calceolata.AAC.5
MRVKCEFDKVPYIALNNPDRTYAEQFFYAPCNSGANQVQASASNPKECSAEGVKLVCQFPTSPPIKPILIEAS